MRGKQLNQGMYWLSTLKAMQCSKMDESGGFASKIKVTKTNIADKKTPNRKEEAIGRLGRSRQGFPFGG